MDDKTYKRRVSEREKNDINQTETLRSTHFRVDKSNQNKRIFQSGSLSVISFAKV